MSILTLENLKIPENTGSRLDVSHFRLGGIETAVICGPSGAGKTMLLRAIAGLCKSTGVHIASGSDALTHREILQKTFYAPQPASWGWLGHTLMEEFNLLARGRRLSEWLTMTPSARNTELKVMLGAWQLDKLEDRNPSELSQGEQNLFGLALAEFSRAPIVLLDGYPGAMDLAGTRLFLEFMGRLKDQKRSVYVASNDIERFLAHMDRMILMKEGRIILDALPERVLPYLEAHGLRKPQLKLQEMSWMANSK